MEKLKPDLKNDAWVQDTQCVNPTTETTVPQTQFSAASPVMDPEMLIWSTTAQNKDYFPTLFVARDQVISKFGLISLFGVNNLEEVFLKEGGQKC